ncbi:MAG: hypothetical protein F6K54_13185 [Okeania sp. SIO3B5]|uniref:hypothetical protein n=1 Tax=Okeania sp. SIO3B5 TaxID=2607811 RepID=UPI0013FF5953|nr:hypothetical protein [Okeania sp. SIO3B5]NEO53947.1 hypothetical protein [Okeania sp. SIO3B5]
MKEEVRRKKEEGRRKKEEGKRENCLWIVFDSAIKVSTLKEEERRENCMRMSSRRHFMSV